MSNSFGELSNQAAWRVLVGAAKKGAEAAGYVLSRMPGRGRSNIWRVEKDGKAQIASVRTTRDRWIAFPPLDGGSRWKTLDEVDLVIVAAVDRPNNPHNVEVYLFEADEVRQRFAAAYAARTNAGNAITDNFGMWVSLDPYEHFPGSIGSGLASEYKPLEVYSLREFLANGDSPGSDSEAQNTALSASDVTGQPQQPATVAEVMAWARERLAEIADVRPEAVKLHLRIEY